MRVRYRTACGASGATDSSHRGRSAYGAAGAGDWPLEALEALGVPYAVHDACGRQTYRSSAALTLLADDPTAESIVWTRAASLAATVLACTPARRATDGAAPAARSTRVHSHARAYVLSAYVPPRQPGGGPPASAVVSVLPAPHPAPAAPDLRSTGLTSRQAEVALLVAAGRSTKEVASALAISSHTARHHTEQVFTKLGVRGRVALALLLGGAGAGPSP